MTNVYKLIPRATFDEPHKELDWIFGLLERETGSPTFSHAKKWYLRFIHETNAGYPELAENPRFFITRYWETDALIRFTSWLTKQVNTLKSKTRYSIYKNVRRAMDYAYSLGFIDQLVYHAPMFKGVRETDQRSPYSVEEQEVINTVLSKWVMHAKNLCMPYEKSGKNSPKATKPSKKISQINITVQGKTWSSVSKAAKFYGKSLTTVCRKLKKGASPEEALGLESFKLIETNFESTLLDFESRFQCDPLEMLVVSRKDRSYTSIQLMNFFMKIGVWPFIDRRLIMPLAAELCRLTGLNAESVASMTIDSYQPNHPLTNQPFISFKKSRSGSAARSEQKELHLSLLEQNEIFLDANIQEQVSEIIKTTLNLTSRIRPYARGDTAHRLFIYEHDGWYGPVPHTKKISHIVWGAVSKEEKKDNPHLLCVSPWTKVFSKDNGLNEVLGKEFRFNFSRFRSTMINEMVKAGLDIFNIKAAMGHQNISTTATYLSENQLDPQFDNIIKPALEKIAGQSNKDSECTNQNTINSLTPEENFYTESLSGLGCKNAFRPSLAVRELTGHVEGTPCKFWNMCLLCEQSSITENGLPKLISYKWKLEAFTDEAKLNMYSRKELYQQIIKVIDDILKPDHHFSGEVIKNAELIALEMDDEDLDQLVYQGF